MRTMRTQNILIEPQRKSRTSMATEANKNVEHDDANDKRIGIGQPELQWCLALTLDRCGSHCELASGSDCGGANCFVQDHQSSNWVEAGEHAQHVDKHIGERRKSSARDKGDLMISCLDHTSTPQPHANHDIIWINQSINTPMVLGRWADLFTAITSQMISQKSGDS